MKLVVGAIFWEVDITKNLCAYMLRESSSGALLHHQLTLKTHDAVSR